MFRFISVVLLLLSLGVAEDPKAEPPKLTDAQRIAVLKARLRAKEMQVQLQDITLRCNAEGVPLSLSAQQAAREAELVEKNILGDKAAAWQIDGELEVVARPKAKSK